MAKKMTGTYQGPVCSWDEFYADQARVEDERRVKRAERKAKATAGTTGTTETVVYVTLDCGCTTAERPMLTSRGRSCPDCYDRMSS